MADYETLPVPGMGLEEPAPTTTTLMRWSWSGAATIGIISVVGTVLFTMLIHFQQQIFGLADAATISIISILVTIFFPQLNHLQKQIFGRRVHSRVRWLAAIIDPDMSVTISQYEGGIARMGRRPVHSELYRDAKAYLGDTCWRGARHLRGESAKNAADECLFSMLDGEEVADVFDGATVWWTAYKNKLTSGLDVEWYVLYYHEQHRDLVLGAYLQKVRREGRDIIARGRQRKIFTNTTHDGWAIHVQFEHRKTFDKLAMDPARKQEIIDDLEAFKNGKEYYAHLGKPWKRGYLLHGPPGTGKSTMVAAMANFLDYDVYDLELTSVKSNTELRRLLVATKSKSIIVTEDIDCLLDILRSRDKMKPAQDELGGKSAEAAPATGVLPDENNKVASGVTLSGVLNFVDGLWSACGEERIIVFTTNHLEELDPALIRRGRMDMHIEMSYCGFEAFKSLAKLYLDVESHELFGAIAELLGEVNMTPADVAENLTRKKGHDDADAYLEDLVKELEKIKKEAN